MTDFMPVFDALKAIISPFSDGMDLVSDTEDQYYLDTAFIQKNKKPLFFGSVQIKKRYVSYYLMPIYVNPELLSTISPDLKKRMQGKSCFNFTSIDNTLFDELADLTNRGFQDYKEKGFL